MTLFICALIEIAEAEKFVIQENRKIVVISIQFSWFFFSLVY